VGVVSAFNNVSLDGFFADENNDMSWAHNMRPDPEWQAYVEGNTQSDSTLLFGRVTYQMMASFWPTPAALQGMPAMAKQMNERSKIVFSRTLNKTTWNNSRLVTTDPAAEVKRLVVETKQDLTLLGSGTIITQLLEADLLDDLTIVVTPILLGKGKSMFATAKQRHQLPLTNSRRFQNGNIVLQYSRA